MTTTPKYLRLRDLLLGQIKSGHFPDGKLHPLLQIAKDNKVSIVTAQKAVKLLEKDGIVTCNPDNRGTTINQGKADFLNGATSFNPFRDIVVYSKRKVKISYFNSEYLPFTKPGWDNIVAAFQRQYPWIEVQFVDSSNFSDPVSHQTPCDAFQVMSRDLYSWVKQGIIAPLDEFLCGDMSCFDALHEQARPPCLMGETTYALPQSFAIPLIFYHKRRLAGILPDQQITDWRELERLVGRIGEHGFAAYVNIGLWTYWSHFIGKVSANLLKIQYDSDLLFSLELLKGIHAVSPHSLSEDFFAGKGALLCLYSSYTDLFTEQLDQWNAQLLPLTPAGIRVFSPQINCVDARSPYREEAFLFIKFLTSEYAQKQLALHNTSYPFHKEFLQKGFYSQRRKYLRELDINSMLNESESLIPTSTFINILYDNIFLPALTEYFTASITTRSVLDYIKSRIVELYPVYMKNPFPEA